MSDFSLSIFSSNHSNMLDSLNEAKEYNAAYLHFDVMDGIFVPMTGLSICDLEYVLNHTTIPIDVHLMTYNLKETVKEFAEFCLNSIAIHIGVESYNDTIDILNYIRNSNIKSSIAISPENDILEIEKYLDFIDEIIIMTAKPGIKNSSFIENSFETIKKASYILKNSNIIISVDGALDIYKALKCIENGAEKIIMGRYFYNSSNKLDLVNSIINNKII